LVQPDGDSSVREQWWSAENPKLAEKSRDTKVVEIQLF
jgi:hypothetical protein